MAKRTVNVSIDADLAERAYQEKAERRISLSALIERALDRWFYEEQYVAGAHANGGEGDEPGSRD